MHIQKNDKIGPPINWLSTHELPVGGAFLDSGTDRHDSRFSTLALIPSSIESFNCTDLSWSKIRHFPRPTVMPAELHHLNLPYPKYICALSYELVEQVEKIELRTQQQLPHLWIAQYDAVYVWDRIDQQGWLISDSVESSKLLEQALLNAPIRPISQIRVQPTLQTDLDQYTHHRAVEQIQSAIFEGDVYQVNLTTSMTLPFSSTPCPTHVYLTLREKNPASYGVLLRINTKQSICSLSPELFLKWDQKRVYTAPIKGTRPRGKTLTDDQRLSAELMQSEKDKAEHLMIVDLERNDLGKICKTGTVRVDKLMELKSFPSVHHLVSEISGELRTDVDLYALLRATFPGGSISGAPKVRALQMIRSLETKSREIYCGALGYIDPWGGGVLNLPIRTAWISDQTLYYHAGGGIVADSKPLEEWDELWVKTHAFLSALNISRP